MKKRIYNCDSLEQLKEYKVTKHNIKYILNYYFILQDYLNMALTLDNNKAIIKNKKMKYLFDFYYTIYYLFENVRYQYEKYYYKLESKDKIIMDIFDKTSLKEQQNIFDKELYNLKYYAINDVFMIIYLINLIRNDCHNLKKYNFKIRIKINKILYKRNLGINDVYFLNSILEIIIKYYSIYLNLNNYSLLKIEKIITKQCLGLSNYKNILKNKIINYNENIIMTLRIINSLSIDEEFIKRNLEKLNNFINNNDVEEYTKFLLEVVNNNITDINIYINKITSLINDKKSKDGEICNTIYLYATKIENNKQFKEYYEALDKIDIVEDNPKYNEFTIYKNLIKFWSGERGEKIDTSCLNLEFTKLILDYYYNKINYKKLLEELKKMKRIDSYEIFNWYRFHSLFNDYNWLSIILTKIDNIDVDLKLKNYLIWFYVSILNDQNHLILKDFQKINSIAISIIKDNFLKMYSLLVRLQVYQEWNEEIINLIKDILNSNLDNNDYKRLLYIIIFNLLKYKCKDIPKELLKNNIDNNITDNKYLYYCSLVFIFEEVFDYNNIINYLFSLYNNSDLVDDITFSIMASIATKIMYKSYNINYDEDIIYYNNNKFYGNVDAFKDIYAKLHIKYIEGSINYNGKKSLIELLITRIYLKNIEKYGQGKVIKISSKDPKELIRKIDSITRLNDNPKIEQIYNGEIIDTFWFNFLSLDLYLKSIKSKIDQKFINSFNPLILNNKKFITITSLGLLCKLGLIKYILGNNNYYCTGYTYNYFEKYKENDLVNDVLEDVFYGDMIQEISDVLKAMKKESRIEYVSNANTLGLYNIENINEWDIEIFKILIDNNNFSIVTEDPFYFSEDFRPYCHGTFTLIIDMFQNKIISSKELYEATKCLESLNYNLKVNIDVYYYILNHANDKYINGILRILNKYN